MRSLNFLFSLRYSRPLSSRFIVPVPLKRSGIANYSRPITISNRRYINTKSSAMGPTIKLSSGHEMPQVGFGLWKVDNATCADTVYNAIKAGYRLFDGACGKSREVTYPPNCFGFCPLSRGWRDKHDLDILECPSSDLITPPRTNFRGTPGRSLSSADPVGRSGTDMCQSTRKRIFWEDNVTYRINIRLDC